jgi:hypothetical protein
MTISPPDSPAVAVVSDRHSAEAAAIEQRLAGEGRSVRWCQPCDLDLVEGDVRDGRVNLVVFGQCADLLAGIWSGQVSFPAWRDSGVRVEFVESPGEDAAALLVTVADAWTRYSRVQRRRRLIAGVILSLLAVVAVFVLTR